MSAFPNHSPASDLKIVGAENPNFELEGKKQNSFFNRRRIFGVLSRWPWIVLCIIISLLYGYFQAWRAVELYQANSSLLVRDYNISVMGNLDASAEFDLRSGQAVDTVRSGLDRFELYEAIASDPLIRERRDLQPPPPLNIRQLWASDAEGKHQKMDQPAPPAPVLAEMIKGWTSTSVRLKSRFIDISVSHPIPQVAELIANRVVHHYIIQRENQKSSGAQNAVEYLIGEADRVKTELQTAENVLNSYATPLQAEQGLIAAENLISNLKVRYKSKHPRMEEAQRSHDLTYARLSDALKLAMENPSDKEYWAPYREKLNDFTDPATVEKVRPLLVARKSTLDSEIQSQSILYKSLLSNIETKEITSERTEAEVVAHEKARLPENPSSPDKKKIILNAAMGGAVAGLLLALIFQFFDNKIQHVGEIEEEFNRSVLSAIASLEDKKQLREICAAITDLPPCLAKLRPELIATNWGGKTHHTEMFRVLRASISLLGNPAERKITLISSSLPNEGKTFVASNLALAFANQGTKTLLIDFDLRKASVHQVFGEKRTDHKGTVDLLNQTATLAEVVHTYESIDNFSVVFAGEKAPNPGELLEPMRLKELLDRLSAEFDHIVIDTPPLLAVPDTRVIIPLANNIALVARANQTPRRALKTAISLIEKSGHSPSGFILNDYSAKRYKLLDKYGYGSGYGYGYGSYKSYGTYGYDDKD